MMRSVDSVYTTAFDLEDVITWEDSERSQDKLAGLSPAERLDVIAHEAEWFYSGGTADDED